MMLQQETCVTHYSQYYTFKTPNQATDQTTTTKKAHKEIQKSHTQCPQFKPKQTTNHTQTT